MGGEIWMGSRWAAQPVGLSLAAHSLMRWTSLGLAADSAAASAASCCAWAVIAATSAPPGFAIASFNFWPRSAADVQNASTSALPVEAPPGAAVLSVPLSACVVGVLFLLSSEPQAAAAVANT